MKKVLALFVMMTANVFAVEKKELMPLIEEASTKRESAYLEVRNRIAALGTNALPLLADIAVDEALPWQQRLVARICYERIERKEEIKKLIETDWYKHPDFNPEWRQFLPGPEGHMGGLVMPALKEAGWYYCLEFAWKDTGEKGNIIDKRLDLWAYWCVLAVKDNPEERIWFLRVCAELTENTPPDPIPPLPRIYWLHQTLLREKKADVVPVIFQYLSLRNRQSNEIGPWFDEVLGYADSRSADALEAFVASRQKSEGFAPELATVRTRTAPPPAPEPPFRLGTNIVKRINQP